MAFKFATTETGHAKKVYHIVRKNRPVTTFCGQKNFHTIVGYPPVRHWICFRCMESIAATLRDHAWRFRQIKDMTGVK